MSQGGVPAIGASIVLSLDGQKVTGKVTAIQADKLVVRLTILQPAKAYQGVKARAVLPDGQDVSFDLGGAAYYSELLVEVPLPAGSRVSATPRAGAIAATPVIAKPAPKEPAEGAAEPKNERLEAAIAKPALNKEPVEEPTPGPVAETKPAPEKPADERRHYFRFAVDCPVEVVENVGHTREYTREEGHTLNLSGGGMLAEFDKALLPGSYRFRLHLSGEPMLVTGRVIKKGDAPPGRVAAIEFQDLHEAERSKLIRFIFNMMRGMKAAARGQGLEDADKPPERKAEKTEKEKAYWRRREKYFQPKKIRYW